jgi:peroxiredoxin
MTKASFFLFFQAPIAVGATVPDAVLSTALVDFGADVCARPTPLSTASLFDGKKVVVVGVPGGKLPRDLIVSFF